ncbi:hypothetical protein Q8W71_32215 [Methylobacterium sp. NEAU 140]|uniref:hypothetical protein n=1 Tax=Methylobacterium sp. NEAU 140 TaxID=3064945 RepID=UPI002733FB0B|nr:hypothetical protein [Methylobacterium sp. NEAU 140]MDP4027238.1 hypothetical protein [Methylobacterium sp. NEAU 140]
MLNLTLPLIAATVFTAGGYCIFNAKRHVEAIKEFLVVIFLMCACMTLVGMIAFFAARLTPRPMTEAITPAQTASVDVSAAEAHSFMWTKHLVSINAPARLRRQPVDDRLQRRVVTGSAVRGGFVGGELGGSTRAGAGNHFGMRHLRRAA